MMGNRSMGRSRGIEVQGSRRVMGSRKTDGENKKQGMIRDQRRMMMRNRSGTCEKI